MCHIPVWVVTKKRMEDCTMKEKFIENGIEYVRYGDYLPNLKVPEEHYHIGKYGRLHEKFIKEHYKGLYTTLFMTGKLHKYLTNIDLRAKKELDRLIPLLAEKRGITEQLKAENQLKWVGLMNNVKAQAEEIIYKEIVYVIHKF